MPLTADTSSPSSTTHALADAWRRLPLWLRIVLESIAIYAVYNLLGEANRRFTPPPTGISPIWLPAGFAVGVVLVRGWWTTIPLFLTGFVNTLRVDWHLTDPVAQGGSGIEPSTLAWAATLFGLSVAGHCIAARLLVGLMRRSEYDGVWSALGFLLFTGPVSCVVSALLGTEVFRVEGFVTADTFAVSAFTFWIGDSIACMLVAPVAVALAGGSAWRTRRMPIVVLAAATSAIVLASTSLVGRTELERIRQTFERSSTRAVATFEARVRRLENLALDQATLIGAAGDIGAARFDAAALDKVRRSEGAELIAYLAVADGDPDTTSVRYVAGSGAEDYRLSFTRDAVLGALDRARASGEATWVPRADDPGAVHDFVYAPVFRGAVDASALSVAKRRESLIGFVAVRTDLQSALAASTDSVVDRAASSVVRSERTSSDPVVLAALPLAGSNPLIDSDLSPLAAARTKGVPFASRRTFDLESSPWSVTFAPSRSFVTDRSFLVAVLPSSLIAMAFTLTIMMLALTSTGQRARLARLVRQRTWELQRSERRYRSVVDNVREAIFQLDEHDRITFVSAAWGDTPSVVDRQLALGQPLVEVLRVADPDRLVELVESARARPGRVAHAELESLGGEHVFEVRLATHAHHDHDEHGDLVDDGNHDAAGTIVGMVVNITDQRQVLRNRERFVSLVAHELRNPLTVISGSVATITGYERDDLPPLATKLLPSVAVSAHRLERIIADLLVSSQVDAGTLTLVPRQADLRAIVDESVRSAQVGAHERGIALEIDDAAVADVTVTCDVDRVAQVVDNLLSNAIKYTPAGGRVTVSIARDEPVRRVHVTVRDTGIGIAPEDHERVFERYGRTEQGTIVAPGTGLGLSICRALAQAHGGTIELESSLGGGSTFTLSLPVR